MVLTVGRADISNAAQQPRTQGTVPFRGPRPVPGLVQVPKAQRLSPPLSGLHTVFPWELVDLQTPGVWGGCHDFPSVHLGTWAEPEPTLASQEVPTCRWAADMGTRPGWQCLGSGTASQHLVVLPAEGGPCVLSPLPGKIVPTSSCNHSPPCPRLLRHPCGEQASRTRPSCVRGPGPFPTMWPGLPSRQHANLGSGDTCTDSRKQLLAHLRNRIQKGGRKLTLARRRRDSHTRAHGLRTGKSKLYYAWAGTARKHDSPAHSGRQTRNRTPHRLDLRRKV